MTAQCIIDLLLKGLYLRDIAEFLGLAAFKYPYFVQPCSVKRRMSAREDRQLIEGINFVFESNYSTWQQLKSPSRCSVM
jgi:hypothetical protein